MRIETRLSAGTTFGGDWHDVLSAVFAPLDARSPGGPYGFEPDEVGTLTRGQQVVFNLRWLRDFIEGDTFLVYWDEPGLRAHAGRLVEDARLIGADAFAPVIAEMVALVGDPPAEPPFEDDCLSDVERLERELFALEEQHGKLWDILADYIRRTPDEFVRQG
jgi:hypothetical protein